MAEGAAPEVMGRYPTTWNLLPSVWPAREHAAARAALALKSKYVSATNRKISFISVQ
jgi:hypothetical protein